MRGPAVSTLKAALLQEVGVTGVAGLGRGFLLLVAGLGLASPLLVGALRSLLSDFTPVVCYWLLLRGRCLLLLSPVASLSVLLGGLRRLLVLLRRLLLISETNLATDFKISKLLYKAFKT